MRGFWVETFFFCFGLEEVGCEIWVGVVAISWIVFLLVCDVPYFVQEIGSTGHSMLFDFVYVQVSKDGGILIPWQLPTIALRRCVTIIHSHVKRPEKNNALLHS